MAVKSLKSIQYEAQNKSPESLELIKKAYYFSKEKHKGQIRYSGEDYFIHPAEVGFYLSEMGMDTKTIAAGLLHDTIEDTDVTAEEIEKEFGDEILCLVQGVTKLGTLRYHGLERHVESLRKLFAATATDIRVLIIKLMDRLHNTRTLEHVPTRKQKRIAQETLEIYAPIADRLGMGIIKKKLEDSAFPYAMPKEYKKIKDVLKERSKETKKRLEKTEKAVKRIVSEAGIKIVRTESRVKGLYSLYKKLERKDWDITKIHDILALRVIVETTSDCYTVLGIIHGEWRPIPGKIKDYIACEKPNGYQSIHTTIHTGSGGTLEIQIRTEKMHQEAQFGIASHLSYKGAQQGVAKNIGMEWVRQFLPKTATQEVFGNDGKKNYSPESVPRWIKDLSESREDKQDEEYLTSIKSDFFTYRIFVFTPNGDVIDLPIDATPIDFAYAIHSDIGNHTSGAKVSGKFVSLDTTLKNGDIVEIETKRSSKPTQKWMDMAKTALAKRHIRAYLARQTKND